MKPSSFWQSNAESPSQHTASYLGTDIYINKPCICMVHAHAHTIEQPCMLPQHRLLLYVVFHYCSILQRFLYMPFISYNKMQYAAMAMIR